jgi:hypothetical protein
MVDWYAGTRKQSARVRIRTPPGLAGLLRTIVLIHDHLVKGFTGPSVRDGTVASYGSEQLPGTSH